jgi:tellurite resistance protein TerC
MALSWGVEIEFIAGFIVFIVAMLMLDLLVFHRDSKKVSIKEAAGWSAFWISLALAFNVGLYFWLGKKPAMEFLTGYLIEESLSIDNLFIFIVIFNHFRVPPQYQHRVLFWGIIGAIVLRGLMIFAGVALVNRFHWVLYLFGAFLLYAAVKMAFHKDAQEEAALEKNRLLKFLRKRFKITPDYHGDAFTVVKDGVRWMTPLVPVVVVIESSDLMFAFDSIPAIFAVTTDPLIVFTSNMFAILGLRSLYFLLADVMKRFVYLDKGLAVILAFVAVKILISGWYVIPTPVSLGVVASVMAVSVAASLLGGKGDQS